MSWMSAVITSTSTELVVEDEPMPGVVDVNRHVSIDVCCVRRLEFADE